MSQKFAIVTGASSGVGGAIALELAKSGYFVALVGRNKTRLEEVKVKITKAGASCQIFTADLNTIDGINKLIDDLKVDIKQVDVLVNAAAIWHGEDEVYAGKDFTSFSQPVVTDTMMVGLIAPTLLSHALIPQMPPKSKIINISGTFENGGKGWIPYYVSKRGIEDLTVGLADELKERDIQVNAISPSDTATPAYAQFFPQYLDESINPIEIAKQAVVLCSQSGNNITGQVFVMKKDEPVISHFHA